MDIMQFLDIILHVDKVLGTIITQYGTWVYVILFAIIFCETGLVVAPFLPGDTLLFIGGGFLRDRCDECGIADNYVDYRGSDWRQSELLYRKKDRQGGFYEKLPVDR